MFFLSARAREAGKGVKPVAALDGGHLDPGKAGLEHWVIFVHGYHTSQGRAEKVWKQTTRMLEAQDVSLDELVLLFWPGDHFGDSFLSGFMYPLQIPVAETVGRYLADYLQMHAAGRRMPLQVRFVAHSLGSLVVLEALRQLRDRRANVRVDKVLLMAAAVPEGFCTEESLYGRKFSKTTAETVLYSHADRTLKYGFRFGQRLGKHVPSERRRAVGRTGGPGSGEGRRWTGSAEMDIDHGEYWNSAKCLTEIKVIVSAGLRIPDRKLRERTPGEMSVRGTRERQWQDPFLID